LTKTDLDIVIASRNQLSDQKFRELRKLWIHGVHADTNAVGWLPTSVFDSRARSDEVTAVYRDGDLVGWCLRGESKARKILKVFQIWVRPDARIIEHGRALIDHVRTQALATRCGYLEAWVADDLEANYFWPAIGFTRTVWRWGRGSSLRKIYRWITTVRSDGGKNDTLAEWRGIDSYDHNKWRHPIYS
jgi:GNAT superfamily N-acetyltransferase